MKITWGTGVTSALSVLALVGAGVAATTTTDHGPASAEAHGQSSSTPSKVVEAKDVDIKLVKCGRKDRFVWVPIGGGWSKTQYGKCGHIAGGKKPSIGVSWEIDGMSSGRACVKARGYRWSDGKPYWVSAGCGTSGGATVHWGKTNIGASSVTAVKAKSQTIVTGVPVYFTD